MKEIKEEKTEKNGKLKMKDPQRLRHIVEAITEVENYVKEAEFEDFIVDSMMLFATIKQLEIIGDEAAHVSTELKEKYSEINWSELEDFRKVMRREQFGMNYDIIWDAVQEKLHGVRKKIQGIIDLMEL